MTQIGINSVTVLGAGTMGAQIALHCANAGIPALLLDLTADVAQAGTREGAQAETRSAVHARRLQARDDRRLRHASRSHRQDRLDHGSRRRAARHQAAAAREGRREAAAGIDRQLEHLRHSDRGDRRRTLGRFPQALARHALLQSTALPAAARDHSNGRNRSGGGRRHGEVRRPRARQGRRDREGHAELHRQPHRPLRSGADRSMRLPAASTPSRRSTRSPAPRSAGPAARRSGRWISPASTCSRTCCATSTSA